ncbi:hypothetical protein [Sinomonas halotolerans]|uniref:ATP-grasp domain-containing protein n=1 Tax=Sinomonas halotolerans TaxID=1644133 RepID=A0ABU9X0J7_9MICC
MILLAGIPSEPPVRLVAERLAERGAPVAVFDQRHWDESWLDAEVRGRRITGALGLPGGEVALESVHGVFTRLMDDSRLPDIEPEPAGSPRREACRSLHAGIAEWFEATGARVLNRARPQASNSSKPYQAQRIRAQGFSVPETLITNDPDAVLRFRERHGRIVYKSASGVRSIVREFGADDAARLALIRWCPTQFQERVPGTDVRVHVVGRRAFATEIASEATDYRYATRDGGSAELRPADLPEPLLERCIGLADSLGLPLAGIDLRLAPEGRVVCFEVNPSPAFSYYESQTGQRISAAIAEWLLDGG